MGALPYDLALSDDKGLKLSAELFCALFLVVRELDGLTEVKAENTEDGLSVYLVLAGLEVNVAVEADKNVNEFINIIDFSELNVECHGDFLSLLNCPKPSFYNDIIYHFFILVNSFFYKVAK